MCLRRKEVGGKGRKIRANRVGGMKKSLCSRASRLSIVKGDLRIAKKEWKKKLIILNALSVLKISE